MIKQPKILIILIILAIAIGFILFFKSNKTEDDTVFCIQDVKMCADGSSVGRVPPSCEFAKCPGEKEPLY